MIGKSLNISCYTSITYLPSYVVCIGLDCTIYSGISVTKTECHNDGGGGGGSGPSDTFCDDTNCNEFPSPGSGFPLEEDDQIILDASFVEDENAECIWDKLMQIHGFQKIAGQFAGVKSEFDVVLKIGQTANSSATAQTQWMGNNSPIEITFNQNQMGRSALEVARTVLHEMLHADFYRAINTHSPTLSDISFKETFEEYTRQYAGDGAIHHNLMADRYINYMANILQEIHPQLGGDAFSDYMNYPGGYPNGIPRAFYEALAWDGLRLVEIKGWTNKTETEKSNIQMHINNAQSGRKSCGN